MDDLQPNENEDKSSYPNQETTGTSPLPGLGEMVEENGGEHLALKLCVGPSFPTSGGLTQSPNSAVASPFILWGKALLNYYCDNNNRRLNTLCWSSAFGPFGSWIPYTCKVYYSLCCKIAIKLHNLLG